MGAKDSRGYTPPCNHHPETCSCNSKLDRYPSQDVLKKRKRKRKRKNTSLATDIYRVKRHDKKVAKDERNRELTDTRPLQSFSYNNDPCIACGSRVYKSGRICPSCWG